MPELNFSQIERFLRPFLASSFLTISAVIHVMLILLFGGKVLFSHYVEPPDFQSAGDSMVAADTSTGPPPPAPDSTLPATSTAASANAPPPLPAPNAMAMSTMNPMAANISVPLQAIAPPTIGREAISEPAPQFHNAQAVALPGAMAARGANRDTTGAQYGEKPPAGQAVTKALQWLQTQQQSDGTWGSGRFTDAFTGLALLCFLGHGDTPQNSSDYRVVVTNAINWLVAEGTRKEGRYVSGKDFNAGPEGVYEHAICTCALCEAYTMTKDPRLEPLVRQAVDYIVKGQRADGGWTARYDTTPDRPNARQIKSDTSVSGWQIQALKAAYLTGIDGMAQTVRPALDNAMNNLDRVFDPQDGTYGYRKAGDAYDKKGTRVHDLTGVGVLAKIFWLGREDKDTREAIKDIESGNLVYNSPNCDLYAWYFDTQACFQAQGSAWQWWNARFQDLLTSEQSPDGTWPPSGGNHQGTFQNVGNFQTSIAGDGPVYRTTLCCLMLEVFYRYAPATQSAGGQSGQIEGL